MKILIAQQFFVNLTGAELYAYELSKELSLLGYQVTIGAQNLGNTVLVEKALANNVTIKQLSDCKDEYDIVQFSEPSTAEFVLKTFTCPIIQIVHSQYPCEEPVIDDRIVRYIAIRKEVYDKMCSLVDEWKVELVYNGVDTKRFTKGVNPKRMQILFVGTIDSLRKASILDLIENAKVGDYDVLFIGTKHSSYLDNIDDHQIKWIDSHWDIENETKNCTMTAGILLGRTTIEGWMCNKCALIYKIDLNGNIIGKHIYDPPKDMSVFSSIYMAKRMENIYNSLLWSHTPKI